MPGHLSDYGEEAFVPDPPCAQLIIDHVLALLGKPVFILLLHTLHEPIVFEPPFLREDDNRPGSEAYKVRGLKMGFY